jgi:hypothetical protein
MKHTKEFKDELNAFFVMSKIDMFTICRKELSDAEFLDLFLKTAQNFWNRCEQLYEQKEHQNEG